MMDGIITVPPMAIRIGEVMAEGIILIEGTCRETTTIITSTTTGEDTTGGDRRGIRNK